MPLWKNCKPQWNLLLLQNNCNHIWWVLKTQWPMNSNCFLKSNNQLNKKLMPKYKHSKSNNHKRKKRRKKNQSSSRSSSLKLWINLYLSLHRWNHPHLNSLLAQNLSRHLKMRNGFCLSCHKVLKNLLFSSTPVNMDLTYMIGLTEVLENNSHFIF